MPRLLRDRSDLSRRQLRPGRQLTADSSGLGLPWSVTCSCYDSWRSCGNCSTGSGSDRNLPLAGVMKITVAICTWNRCALLRQALEQMTSLEAPSGVTWEVLVVNNNCTDATDDVIASFQPRLAMRRVFEARPGLTNARNRALTKSRGDYIVFTDDDVLVNPQWLIAFVDAARRHPEAAAFTGPVEPWFPVSPDPVLIDVFPELRRGFCGTRLDSTEGPLPDELLDTVCGVNMGFRINAVQDLRFDPKLGPTPEEPGKAGDEADFLKSIRRRGGSVLWCPDMTIRHFVDPSRMSLAYLLRFSFGRGRMLIRRDGVSGPRIAGVPRWILTRLIRESATYALLALSPGRRRALRALRECSRLRGMMAECLDLRREAMAARRPRTAVHAGQSHQNVAASPRPFDATSDSRVHAAIPGNGSS